MAETTVQNGQTCLEKRGIEARHEQIVRSDYNKDNQYSSTHPDALGTDGDEKGKGTGHNGHTFFIPDCTKPTTLIDYSNFDSQNGGSGVDQQARKTAMVRSLYNKDNQYGPQLVNTSQNIADGQMYLNY